MASSTMETKNAKNIALHDVIQALQQSHKEARVSTHVQGET
jgi:hypothetical protein